MLVCVVKPDNSLLKCFIRLRIKCKWGNFDVINLFVGWSLKQKLNFYKLLFLLVEKLYDSLELIVKALV